MRKSHIPEDDAIEPTIKPDCAFCSDNLEAFALGALPDVSMLRVGQHLSRCCTCQDALRDIRRVTTLLPFLAEPDIPSPLAKSSLMARIAISKQGTPEETRPVVLANPWVSPDKATTGTPETAPEAGSKPGIWQRWIVPGVVAPRAICLLLLAAWTNSLHNEVENLRSAGDGEIATTQDSEALAYDMQLYEFKPACEECEDRQASGQLGGNPNNSVGVVVAWNLDPNEKHQVWCVDINGEKMLVTDLDVEFTGNVFQTVNFPQAIGGYQQIYVARHDGTADPDAELLVAMNDDHEIDSPESTPATSIQMSPAV